MWISRAHYDLIAEKAKDFRAWHEQRVADLQAHSEREIALRDGIIAKQERQIQALEEKIVDRAKDSAKLLELLMQQQGRVDVVQSDEPTLPQWMVGLRDQIDEKAPDAQS